jgi:hypothetical protein
VRTALAWALAAHATGTAFGGSAGGEWLSGNCHVHVRPADDDRHVRATIEATLPHLPNLNSPRSAS